MNVLVTPWLQLSPCGRSVSITKYTEILLTMPIRMIALSLLITIALVPGLTAHAHELQYSTHEGRAILITVGYAGHGALAAAPYEIRRQGETSPVQMGWTDADGRIAFAPRAPGTYQVSVFSEGGHGVNFSLDIEEDLALSGAERPVAARYIKLLVGIGILFGLFGLLMLFYRGRPA